MNFVICNPDLKNDQYFSLDSLVFTGVISLSSVVFRLFCVDVVMCLSHQNVVDLVLR